MENSSFSKLLSFQAWEGDFLPEHVQPQCLLCNKGNEISIYFSSSSTKAPVRWSERSSAWFEGTVRSGPVGSRKQGRKCRARAVAGAYWAWGLLITDLLVTQSETKFSPQRGRGSWRATMHLPCCPPQAGRAQAGWPRAALLAPVARP